MYIYKFIYMQHVCIYLYSLYFCKYLVYIYVHFDIYICIFIHMYRRPYRQKARSLGPGTQGAGPVLGAAQLELGLVPAIGPPAPKIHASHQSLQRGYTGIYIYVCICYIYIHMYIYIYIILEVHGGYIGDVLGIYWDILGIY